MNRFLSAALVVALSTTAISAPAQVAPASSVTSTAAQGQALVLPAGTQIVVANNSEITSTDHRAGQTFPLTVAQDVRVGDHTVIPRGTRAMGEVTWRTGRGAFGKSGKLEFSIRYLEMGSARIPVIGSFRQEGEGNTLATIGVVVLVGLIGGALITGSRARIPAGREMTVALADSTPFLPAHGGTVQLDPAYQPPTVESVTAAELARVRVAAEETCRQTAISRSPSNQRQQAHLTRRCVQQATRQRT